MDRAASSAGVCCGTGVSVRFHHEQRPTTKSSERPAALAEGLARRCYAASKAKARASGPSGVRWRREVQQQGQQPVAA